MEEIKRKRGRPTKEGSRKRQVLVLFTDDEFDRMRGGMSISGENQSELIRNAVESYLSNIEKHYDNGAYYDDYYTFDDV